jgi:hypothetical protein
MLSLRFFANQLCDSLGTAAAILLTMELPSALYFRKMEEGGGGYEQMNTIELDEMKVGSLRPQTRLRNKPHFRFEKSFMSPITRSMQAFGTTELTTQQNLISQFDIYWLEIHVC